MPDQHLTPADLAYELNLAEKSGVKTLATWRVEGRGPKFIKVGRLVRYRRQDVDEWLEERAHQSTTAADQARAESRKRRLRIA